MPSPDYYHQLALTLFQQAKQTRSTKEAADLRARGRKMEVWAEAMEEADAGNFHPTRGEF